MKLFAIETGNLKLDGGAMFGVVPKSLWSKLYACDEKNLCNWAMRCLLIDDGEHRILIDTGMGNKQDENFLRHYYLNGEATLKTSLQNAGYNFSDITDVILTHLHFDHCGGSVCYDEEHKLKPTFPRAKYWVSEKQWQEAVTPNRRERASMLRENFIPIQDTGQLHLVKEDEFKLYPGITLYQYHGHTKGQIIPEITFEHKSIAYMADLLPSTAHIPMPYIMAYDMNPLVTLQDKRVFFERALKNNTVLFFEHDLYHECCTLKQTEKGVRADKTFLLKEFLNAG